MDHFAEFDHESWFATLTFATGAVSPADARRAFAGLVRRMPLRSHAHCIDFGQANGRLHLHGVLVSNDLLRARAAEGLARRAGFGISTFDRIGPGSTDRGDVAGYMVQGAGASARILRDRYGQQKPSPVSFAHSWMSIED